MKSIPLLILCLKSLSHGFRLNVAVSHVRPSRINSDRQLLRNTYKASSRQQGLTQLRTRFILKSSSASRLSESPQLESENNNHQLPRYSKLTALTKLFSYIWPKHDYHTRFYFISSLGLLFFSKLIGAQAPFILQKAVDVGNIGNIYGIDSRLAMFLLYATCRVTAVLLNEFKTTVFAKVSQRALREFSGEIFSHLHFLDSSFHLQNPSGMLSVAYIRGVRGFQSILFQLVFAVVPTMFELSFTASILSQRCGLRYAVATLTTFVAYCAFTSLMTEFRMKTRREIVSLDNSRSAFFVDSISNTETVKLFSNENYESRRYDENYLSKLERLNIRNTNLVGFLNVGQAVIFTLGLTAVIGFTAFEVAAGKMSVGNIVAVNSLLMQLQQPFNFVGYTYQEIRQGFVDVNMLLELLSKKPDVIDSTAKLKTMTTAPQSAYSAPSSMLAKLIPQFGGHSLYQSRPTSQTKRDLPNQYIVKVPSFIQGDIEFRNVSFAYNAKSNKRFVLKNLSFKIKAGETVALVGASGSGKSTALKLLTRLYDVTSGEILVDGIDIRNWPLKQIREQIGVVSQESVLFDDTVRANIKYGSLNATDQLIEQAATAAQVHNAVMGRALGYETRVGERGLKLSGGERQRVSIARTVLRQPAVMLCDEVTSAVDSHTETGIVQSLKDINKHRTTLMVAHRLASVAHADTIMVLKYGVLVEQGKHEELLRSEGLYARMWCTQHNSGLPSKTSTEK